MKTLEFKDKVETLTLNELQETIESSSVGNLTKTLPVEHHQLFNDIGEILDKRNIPIQYDTIYAAGGKYAKRIKRVEQELGEKALGATWLQKVTGQIFLPNTYANDQMKPSIAISYHERGIQVAFGQNITVCSNMTILSTTNKLQTYGPNSIEYKRMLELMDKWLIEIEEKVVFDHNKIESMQQKEIKEPEVIIPYLIGILQMKAVRKNYIDTSIEAPLNISQVNRFSRDYMTGSEKEKPIENVWDLYNVGTNIIKPQNSDITNMIDQNIAFGEFVYAELMN